MNDLIYLKYIIDFKISITFLSCNYSSVFLKLLLKTLLCNNRFYCNNYYIYCGNCKSCILFNNKVHKDLYYVDFLIKDDFLKESRIFETRSLISERKVIIVYNVCFFDSEFFVAFLKGDKLNVFWVFIYDEIGSILGNIHLETLSFCFNKIYFISYFNNILFLRLFTFIVFYKLLILKLLKQRDFSVFFLRFYNSFLAFKRGVFERLVLLNMLRLL